MRPLAWPEGARCPLPSGSLLSFGISTEERGTCCAPPQPLHPHWLLRNDFLSLSGSPGGKKGRELCLDLIWVPVAPSSRATGVSGSSTLLPLALSRGRALPVDCDESFNFWGHPLSQQQMKHSSPSSQSPQNPTPSPSCPCISGASWGGCPAAFHPLSRSALVALGQPCHYSRFCSVSPHRSPKLVTRVVGMTEGFQPRAT